jgi:hypothetical protein
MFGLGFAILALFSLVGIFAGSEDPRQGSDPRDDPSYWTGAKFR